MEIEAINAASTASTAAPATLTERVAPDLPSTEDIDAFTRALFGPTAQTPELAAAGQLQAASAKTEAAFDGARDASALARDPREMFIAQSALLHSVVQVDFIAKAAGSLSQSINKLTSMQ